MGPGQCLRVNKGFVPARIPILKSPSWRISMNSDQVRICVPVCEQGLQGLEQRAAGAASSGDLVEIRLDCLNRPTPECLGQIARLTGGLNCPVIITFRPREQGGQSQADYSSTREFWQTHADLFKQEFLDIEVDLAQEFMTGQSFLPDWQRVICSHHDFDGVPGNLEEIYESMTQTPARVLKLAVRAGDVTDCLPLFQLLDRAQHEGREIIAIAMGYAGIATRILGPSRGAFLTYGSLDPEHGTAPGQLTARELRGFYRIDRLNRQTQIMGIIGLPLGHSVSPQIHNAALSAAGIDGVYIPFEVREVATFLTRMAHPRTREIDWNLRGLSVTAPHKAAVLDHLDWIEPAAKEIGAVNTIVSNDNRLLGYNTDATAILKPVAERLGSLRSARCAVIGAGGVASAALWSLKNEGAEVTVFARDVEKGSELAEKFCVDGKQLESAVFESFDVVINATPLGTRGPLQSETSASAATLRGARLAYDLVYNPRETRFLREAREAGCDTIGGLPMLVLQAAEQFKLWTGTEAPLELMAEAAARAMVGDSHQANVKDE
jgi:3-dehydroquinate dehydratase/shikimate dehydrogenase